MPIFFTLPDSNSKSIKACLNQALVFVDRSTAGTGSPIVIWLWDFGDGYSRTATSSAPDTHRYNKPGVYKVVLTVINQCNCRSTFQMTIDVNRDRGVKIECPAVACEETKISYGTGASCNPYNWSVSGGSILGSTTNTSSIDVFWNQVDASGFGYVYLDNSQGKCAVGCPGVTVVKVPVIQKTGTIDGPDFICADRPVLYRLPQWPTTTFNWAISGGSATLATTDQRNEILLTPRGDGMVTLTCRYYNTLLRCGGDATLTITVTDPPVLTGAIKACTGATETFNASETGDWAMTTPGGITVAGPSGTTFWTPNFTTAGIHRIYFTGGFCPPEPLTVTVKAPPAVPDSLLGPSSACTNVPVQYRAKNSQSGTFFIWTGNSTAFNAASGPTTYATFSGSAPNVISLRRAWADLPGCISAPLPKTVTRPPGVPVLTGNLTPCANSYASYNAGPAFTDADDYEWTINPAGAGSIASGQHTPGVSVLWNNTTTNTNAFLQLKARRCSSTYIETLAISINGIPVIAIVPSDTTVCANQLVSFHVAPAVTGTYNWDLGQTTATGSAVGHRYTPTANGNVTYPITVTITNINGCSGTATAATNITVKPAPMVSITPVGTYAFCGAPSTINLPTLVANDRSGFGGPVTTVDWYHNGFLVAAPGPQPAHTFGTVSQFGSYNAVLTNPNGCSSSTDFLNVLSDCSGTGSSCTPTPGNTLQLSAPAYGCATATLTSSWGSGINPDWIENSMHATRTLTSGATSSTVTYTFDEPGVYLVTATVLLSATSSGYCSTSKTTNVLIPYIAEIRTDITCTGSSYNVKLLDNSKVYPGTVLTYSFYEGSTLLGTANSVSLPAMGAGNHVYSLVISDGIHTPCATSVNINLPAFPSVSIAASRTMPCVKDAVTQFTPTVIPAGFYSYFWDFGDLSANTQEIVSKVYNRTGFSNISLTVSNLYGCTATGFVTVDVKTDNLEGQLSKTSDHPCEGDIVNVYYDPIPNSTNPTSYAWYQPLSSILLSSNSNLNVADPNAFFVLVEDMYGCTWPTDVVPVDFLRIPTPVITGDTDQCEQAAFTLNGNIGPGNYTYDWDRDGSNVQSGPSYELEESGLSAGTYTYTLTVTAPNPPAGICAKTSQAFVVTVHGLPAPPWIDPPNPVSCTPYTLELSAGAAVPGTFNWSNGSSGTPITVYSGGQYRVYFTDEYGCNSQESSFVSRGPSSYLWIFPTGCFLVCAETLVPFDLVGPQAWFRKWAWLYTGTASLPGSNSYVASYTGYNAGIYNLGLHNDFCQVQSGDMNIDISGPCDGESKGWTPAAQRAQKAEAPENPIYNPANALTLSPNPATGSLLVAYSSLLSGNLEVYDVLGRKVASQIIASGSGKWQLDVSAYAPGIYRVVLRQDGKVILHQPLSVEH